MELSIDAISLSNERASLWPGVGRTAMVATANAARRARVTSMLTELGCAVTAVAHGVALVDSLSEAILGDSGPAHRPSIIIADALLAGCTGLSLLAGLRDLRWQTPIILLADRHREELWVSAWRAGVTAILVEPVDYRRLRELSGLLLDPRSGEMTARAFELARSHQVLTTLPEAESGPEDPTHEPLTRLLH